ncbi:MAG: hypothetical protein NBV65_11790, partial [Burkholderiaceae bacterium]|nr:hypothetical protein [Burkholderiaceae bacterium]
MLRANTAFLLKSLHEQQAGMYGIVCMFRPSTDAIVLFVQQIGPQGGASSPRTSQTFTPLSRHQLVCAKHSGRNRMPSADLKRFKLLKRSPAGKITVQDLTAEAVQVDGAHAYTIVESQTGKLPKSLQARRVGDDLQVFSDGEPVIRLEGFYKSVNGNTAFDGSGELFAPVTGSYDSGYALVTGDPLNA